MVKDRRHNQEPSAAPSIDEIKLFDCIAKEQTQCEFLENIISSAPRTVNYTVFDTILEAIGDYFTVVCSDLDRGREFISIMESSDNHPIVLNECLALFERQSQVQRDVSSNPKLTTNGTTDVLVVYITRSSYCFNKEANSFFGIALL